MKTNVDSKFLVHKLLAYIVIALVITLAIGVVVCIFAARHGDVRTTDIAGLIMLPCAILLMLAGALQSIRTGVFGSGLRGPIIFRERQPVLFWALICLTGLGVTPLVLFGWYMLLLDALHNLR
ncbi:hypothetical protein LJR034_009103 [Caballeronia sp. LjRoot34]|uniref:hypothetical protein n=1 Tax=Caballeronia sp. LjRoot34 TaxID=3342325 RepID=UPI003ECFEF42